MALLDDALVARLAEMGIDVTALVRLYALTRATPCTGPPRWQPAADVYEVGDHVVIKLELAGIDVEHTVLTLAGNLAIVHGSRCDESPGQRSGVGHMEIEYGRFEKRLWLPWTVKTTGIRASYRDGFLSIVLEKAARPVRRSISIRVHV